MSICIKAVLTPESVYPPGDGNAPCYQTKGAVGMDLRAAKPSADHPWQRFGETDGDAWDERTTRVPLVLHPGQRALIPTGIRLAIPKGYEGQVRPRSGLALRNGITIPNAPGTVDADYRGVVGVILANIGRRPVLIQPGDRIAQIVFVKVERANLEVVDELDATERGSGGFGHTGV